MPGTKEIVVGVQLEENGPIKMLHIIMECLQRLRHAELSIIADKVRFIHKEDRELILALDKLCIDVLPECFLVRELTVIYDGAANGKAKSFRLSSGMSTANWKQVSHLTMSLRTKKNKNHEDMEVLKVLEEAYAKITEEMWGNKNKKKDGDDDKDKSQDKSKDSSSWDPSKRGDSKGNNKKDDGKDEGKGGSRIKQQQVRRRQHDVGEEASDSSKISSTSTPIVSETVSCSTPVIRTQIPDPATQLSKSKRYKITAEGKVQLASNKAINVTFDESSRHQAKHFSLPEKKFIFRSRVKNCSNHLSEAQRKKLQIVPTKLVFMPTNEERDAEKIRLIDKEKTDRFVKALVDSEDPTTLIVVTKDGQNLHTPLHTFKIYSILEATRILSLISWEGTNNRKARHIFASAIIEMEDAIDKIEKRR